jgi:8-oxo-dGTP diphosphatase
MGKANRTPVLAAGGIVVRYRQKPLVAIVQRRRDDAWVLPKGKLKPNETPIAAARREATEETGTDVRVHEFLGVISYVGGSGPKIVHFWRMRALNGITGDLADDIKAVEWLPLPAAIDQLSLPHERSFLRNVGHKAVKRTGKKVRAKPITEGSLRATDGVVTIGDHRLALVDAASPLAPPAELAKPRTRWQVFARLTKRWHSVAGRTSQPR